MINVVRFQARHWQDLREQPSIAYLKDSFTDKQVRALEDSRFVFTGINQQGRILVCAGVSEYWPGRAEAWAIIDRDSKKEFIFIHNAVRKFIEACPIRRIEAAVALGFDAGHRWVKLLGFNLEAEKLRAYLPTGEDCSLYAKIKG